jgi:glycosyltransferase involved in cell wall biosynthesis
MNVVHVFAGPLSRDARVVLDAAVRHGHAVHEIPTDPIRASLAIRAVEADIVGLHGAVRGVVRRRAVLHADAPRRGVTAVLAVRSPDIARQFPGSVLVPPVPPEAAFVDRASARRRVGVPNGAIVVVAIAPVEADHVRLVEAMAWIDNERQDVWLVTLGGLGAAARAQADRWGIGARMVSHVDDPTLIAIADVAFVSDGSVSATLLAMRAGVPLVSVHAPSTQAFVTDLGDALCVPPGDGEAWSRGILAVIRGEERSAQRAAAARSRAASWKPDQLNAAFAALYGGG